MCPILDDMENAAYRLGDFGKKVVSEASDKLKDVKPTVKDAVEDAIGAVLSKAGEIGDKFEAKAKDLTESDTKEESMEDIIDKEVKERLGKIRASEFASDMITEMFKKKDGE